MAVEDGYGVVGPVTPEVARALLDIAESSGLPPEAIRTTIGGFVAPVDVVSRYEESLGAEPEDEAEGAAEDADYPDATWKNDQIKAWADAHDVDLGESRKKADMLAAISTADKEE